MKEKIRKFISHISKGEGLKAQSQFESIIRNKVRESLENKKIEVAQDIYNNSIEN
jgi:hypothetical protein